ncbi:MAG: S41 family peptidase [Planctomycetota bacterium]
MTLLARATQPASPTETPEPLPADTPSQPPGANARPRAEADEYLELYGMFAEAVTRVELSYAKPVDRRRLVESAIRGMLAELDPYSAYLGPEQLSRYEQKFTPPGNRRPEPTVAGVGRDAAGGWRYAVHERPRVACVAVASFRQTTAGELRDAVRAVQASGAAGLILDLRSNPGGLLTAAVDVADLFLEAGVIVSTQGRGTEPRAWNATAGGAVTGLPLAVLVDRRTASGAEVVAAALQDNGRAVVVGERTWGKGSVQNVFEIADGQAAVKITTATYFRPSGVNIHRFPGMGDEAAWGVSPDQAWTLAVTGGERQAVASRRSALLAGQPAGEPPNDRQLQLAVRAVLDRIANPPAKPPADTEAGARPRRRPRSDDAP